MCNCTVSFNRLWLHLHMLCNTASTPVRYNFVTCLVPVLASFKLSLLRLTPFLPWELSRLKRSCLFAFMALFGLKWRPNPKFPESRSHGPLETTTGCLHWWLVICLTCRRPRDRQDVPSIQQVNARMRGNLQTGPGKVRREDETG